MPEHRTYYLQHSMCEIGMQGSGWSPISPLPSPPLLSLCLALLIPAADLCISSPAYFLADYLGFLFTHSLSIWADQYKLSHSIWYQLSLSLSLLAAACLCRLQNQLTEGHWGMTSVDWAENQKALWPSDWGSLCGKVSALIGQKVIYV